MVTRCEKKSSRLGISRSLIALWLAPKIAMLGIKNKQVYFVLLSLIAIFAVNSEDTCTR